MALVSPPSSTPRRWLGLPVRLLGRALGFFVGRVDPYGRRTVSFTGDLRDDLAGTRLGRILDTVADGILIADRQGHLRFANTAALTLLDLAPGEAGWRTYNTRDWQITAADGGPCPPDHLPIARVIATGAPVYDVEYALERPDGRRVIVGVNAAPLFDEVGRLVQVVATLRDVTERRRTDLAVARLAAVVQSSSDAIIGWDLDQVITDWNPGAEALYGYTADEAIGRPVALLIPPDRSDEPAEILAQARRGEPVAHFETVRVGQDGRRLDVSISVSPIRDRSGEVAGVAVITRDMTDRKRAEQALEHQALHDGLTALPNRVLLHQRLRRALQSADRDRRRPVALIVLDLDRFKEVNDTFGHPAGDVLLQQVGRRLEASLRPTDTLARLGGDEFAVLLPETPIDRAIAVVSRLLSGLDQPFRVEGHDLFVDASFGLAVSPDHGHDADTLLRQADVAMYVAKRAGGGHAVYTPDQDRHSRERLTQASELRQAIQRDELVLQYQPRLGLKTGQIRGVEALALWPHPDRGLIGSDELVPLAEEMGLIDALTRWMLNAALAQGQTWRHAGLTFPISVSLSARSLHADHLAETVALLLARWAAPPGALRLEIGEAAILDDAARGLKVLTSLRSLGVGLAIDEFGTGSASLAYLKQLPVDELKIDKSFIRQVAEDEDDQAIARSAIELGHDLGLTVTAEGVEDRAAWDLLKTLGCDAVQGSAIAPPRPAAEFERWLADNPERGAR